MRKLSCLAIMMCLAAGAAATASGGSSAAPPEARAWLGTWKTNQGKVIFNSLHSCVPGGPNRVAPTCVLDGEWDQPKHGWIAIHGFVFLGPKYKGEVWQGCFAVPSTPAGARCSFTSDGEISIDRLFERFTDGYWKPCGLGALCGDHHPFLGTRVGGVTCPAAVDRASAHVACAGPEPWPFTYEMLRQYGRTGEDGLIALPTTAPEVNPPRYAVTLKLARGGRCEPSWSFDADVDGESFGQSSTDRRDCELHITVSRPGDYTVELHGKVDGHEVAQQQTIRVVNWLIVGLGDSLASGEGNPDIPRGDGRLTGRWEDPACHRSHFSWQSQIAQRLETHDEQTSVTFVSLGCSGAGIASGLLGPYSGLHGSAPITPQLSETQELVGARKVDAVLLSAGINDLGFGSVVNFCATHRNCPDQTYQDGLTVRQYAAAKVAQLPTLYAELKQRLSELAPPSRTYVTVYPDEVHAPDGAFCDAIASNPLGSIDSNEARFLYEDMQLPLNGELQQAFGRGGYHLLGAVQHLFGAHGYCAPEGERWVVTLGESDTLQGDSFGTLHPNHSGHFQIAKLAWTEVLGDLYHDGVPRAPNGG